MNKDDIIKLAQECQLIGMRPHLDGIYQEALELFATLVAAAEREACAKVCDDHEQYPSLTPRHCAAAIRARNKA